MNSKEALLIIWANLPIASYTLPLQTAVKLAINALEQNEILKAALIDERAQYFDTLDRNPDCSAWTFDELSSEEQAELRKQARESLEIEEPLIMLQLAEKDAEIALLKKMLNEK